MHAKHDIPSFTLGQSGAHHVRQLTLDSIAHDSAADLLRDDETETADVCLAGGDMHDCVWGADPFPGSDDTTEVPAADDPVGFGQHR